MALLGYQAFALEFFFLSLATTFVGLRLYVQVYKRQLFNAGDAMCIAALLITAARIALDCEINHLGFWQQLEGMDMAAHYMGTGFDAMWLKMLSAETLVKLCKIWYVQSLMYYTVLWLAKFVLLHLYYSLIPNSMTTLRMLLHFTAAFAIASYIAAMGMSAFWCLPVERNWTILAEPTKMCTAYSKGLPYYITLGLHLMAEALLCIIPLPLIRVLKLNKRKKWGLAFVFGLASLCILCTVAQRTKCTNMSGVDPAMGAWASWEEACSIMVVCSPSLKGFLSRGFMNLKSFRSLYSSKQSSSSTGGSNSATDASRDAKLGVSTECSSTAGSTCTGKEKCQHCSQPVPGSQRISSLFEVVRIGRIVPLRSASRRDRSKTRSSNAIEPNSVTYVEEMDTLPMIGDTLFPTPSDRNNPKKEGGEGFGIGAVTVSEVPRHHPKLHSRGDVEAIGEESRESSVFNV